jgi:protein TonB
MKSLWAIISTARLYMFIFSISIHMLIFSIPISMVSKPQIHEMELFVSVDDSWVPLESVKTKMAIKKPQSEPVKEIIKPIQAPQLRIKKLETTEPVKEVKVEPVGLELNTQPITESKEALIVPPESSITEKNSHVPADGGTIRPKSGIGKQTHGSQNTSRSDAGTLIETRFGATVAPTFLHKEMPVYPMMAKRFGREGKVVLKLTIDKDGNLLNVEVIDRAGYGFTEAAVQAVKKSTFLPAKKDGKPIASRALLPIRFQLERN